MRTRHNRRVKMSKLSNRCATNAQIGAYCLPIEKSFVICVLQLRRRKIFFTAL